METIEYTLSKHTLEHTDADHLRGFTQRVEVTSASNGDTNIFVFAKKPSYTVDPIYTFECVASPSQMENIPPTDVASSELNELKDVPYVRLNKVELLFPNIDKAMEFWNILVHDVKQLADSLSVLSEPSAVQEVTISSNINLKYNTND